MKVKKHINSAVIEIDFSDPESVKDALEFISYFGGLKDTFEKGSFNKISLIKAIRTFALQSIEEYQNGSERPVTLATVKRYVDTNMEGWYKKKD